MNFKELIDLIRQRPGMWIGNLELRNLYNFTNGFTYYIWANKIDDFFASSYDKYFNWWLQDAIRKEYKDNVVLFEDLQYNNSRSFVQLIPLIELDSKKQIDLYFAYVDKFYEDYLKGVDFEAIKKIYWK